MPGRPQRLIVEALSRRRCLSWMAALGAVGVWLPGGAGGEEPQYVRPFGPRAPWNVRIEHVRKHPDSRLHVERLFRDQNGLRSTKFQISTDSHTFPVYDARESAGPTPIKTYWDTNLVGKVPWNPTWKPSPGIEAQLILLDPEHGLEWDFFQVQYKLQMVQATAANLVPGDYRAREDGFLPSRGSGLPYLAMLVRPQEVRQGRIDHALSLTIANISGRSFVSPATKMEFPQGSRTGVPVGMRFALALSDAELDRWAERLPTELSDETRRTVRIVAQALKDYGWFVTETSPGAVFQFEGRQTAGKAWDELGLGSQKVRDKEFPRDLLEGLFRYESVTAYVPSNEYPEAWRARPTPSTKSAP